MPNQIPNIPVSVFTANECQALLDYIERMERYLREHDERPRFTDEEAEAMDKLREAGKFYVPY